MVAASYAVSIGSEKLIGVKPAEKVNGNADGMRLGDC